jgi:DNA polymerase-3 subunit gamma/tau
VLLRMLAFRPHGAGAKQPVASTAAGRESRPVAIASAAPPTPRPAPATAQAAAAAASRLRAPAGEPPPWLDAPDEEEGGLVGRGVVVAREPEPTPPAASPVAAKAALPTFVATPSGARWAELVREMIAANSISAFARELAMQAQCLRLDEAATPVVCQLRVERENLRAPAQCERLQAALVVLLGRGVQLEVVAGTAEDSPARRDAAEKAERQATAEQIIHDDPLVRALMAQYKTARIVPGSIKPH